MAEVAYNPEDIKARLSAVNVYTVANQKNEFVLVSGEVSLSPSQVAAVPASCSARAAQTSCAHHNAHHATLHIAHSSVRALARQFCEALCARRQGDSEERQLGLFFFKEADAKALIDKASTPARAAGMHSAAFA